MPALPSRFASLSPFGDAVLQQLVDGGVDPADEDAGHRRDAVDRADLSFTRCSRPFDEGVRRLSYDSIEKSSVTLMLTPRSIALVDRRAAFAVSRES